MRIFFHQHVNGLPSWELREEGRFRGEGRLYVEGRPRAPSPSFPSSGYSHLPRSRALGCRRTPEGHCHTAARSAALRRGNICKGSQWGLGNIQVSACFPHEHKGSHPRAPKPSSSRHRCSLKPLLSPPPRLIYRPPCSLSQGELIQGEQNTRFAGALGFSGQVSLLNGDGWSLRD